MKTTVELKEGKAGFWLWGYPSDSTKTVTKGLKTYYLKINGETKATVCIKAHAKQSLRLTDDSLHSLVVGYAIEFIIDSAFVQNKNDEAMDKIFELAEAARESKIAFEAFKIICKDQNISYTANERYFTDKEELGE